MKESFDKLRSYNPATGELLGELTIATQADMDQATTNARQAQKQWRSLPLRTRAERVAKAYQCLSTRQEALSLLLAQEMGKDIRRATSEVLGAMRSGPHYAEESAQAFKPENMTGGVKHYNPLGVVGVISPWNYPVMMANNLIVPALVAGNTAILKPSEETPLIAEQFFGALSRSLPEGVLSILHGNGSVGKMLVESDINMIAFTGSRAVGRDIMARSARNLKRLVMELGGNDPMIVLEDADVEGAARFAVAGAFENSGQMCTSIERIYVDQRIAAPFIDRVVAIAQTYRVGPWEQPGVNIGPIINAKQHASILEHIADAEAKGGEIALGGSDQAAPYIYPTVITNMRRDMKLETDETFGPVMGISNFASLDEAIERANDSEYGLGAVVFGHAQAERVAQALEAGMVGINGGQGGVGPWVGAKQSGYGYHGTIEGHRQFAQLKVIA